MIDLSKLKAAELPEKEIEISVSGEKQKVKIRPFGGRGNTALQGISPSDSASWLEKIQVIAMVYGAGMTESQAAFFLENSPDEAMKLAEEIWKFNKEYSDKIMAEREEAKKKSLTGADSENTQV